MRTVLLLLALAASPDEQAERFFEQMKIEPPDLSDDVARRVVVFVLQKEHWVGAYTELADKFGRFPEDLQLSVDFKLEGAEVAQTTSRKSDRKISFNLKRLIDLQKQFDQIAQLKREGKKVAFKVTPMKMERLIYHEMTHVLQGGISAPAWFSEGMAQMVGDDPNALRQFIYDGKSVRKLDGTLTDLNEIYARGHLFWKWLDSSGSATRAYERAYVAGLPWKRALEEATNLSWDTLVSDEQEWSAKELQKLK